MARYEHTIKRRDMVAAGAYDGRYRQKTVKDKKKDRAKKWARSNNKVDRSKD